MTWKLSLQNDQHSTANSPDLTTIIDISPDIVLASDANGYITHANKTAQAFFGYSEALIGMPLASLLPVNDRARHAEMYQAFFTRPVSSMMAKERRVRALLKDGKVRDVAVSLGHTIINDKPIAIAFVRDVTDENAIRHQVQRYKQRTEMASEIGRLTFWQWDKTLNTVTTYCKTTDATTRETIQPLQDFLAAFTLEGQALFQRQLQLCGTSAQPQAFDIEQTITAYAKRTYHVNLAPVISADKKVVGVSGILQDISDQHKLEESLHNAIENAERANLTKSHFINNISHEIRTPINAISGALTLLLNIPLPNKQAQLIKTAHTACRDLIGTVNDILDFSKLENGDITITQKPFNLDQVLNQLIDFYSSIASNKGIQLLLDVKPEVYVNLVGDSLRLSQILGNIVGNALKFTDVGKVKVSVDRVLSHTSSCRIRFCITDTGIGMPEALQNALGAPFTLADGASTRKYAGAGLGISVVKRLLHMMGASLAIRSTIGQGSEFSFEIDFAVPDGAKRYLDLIVESKKAMLVIEDHELEQVVTQYFVHWGINIACFDNIKHAYQALTDSVDEFDLLFVHINSHDEYSRMLEICSKWARNKPDREGSLIIITTEEYSSEPNLLKLHPHIIIQPPTPSRLFDAVNTGRRELDLPTGANLFEIAKQKTRYIKGARALLVEDVHTNQIVAVDMLEALGLHVAVVENGQEAIEAVRNHDFDVVFMDFHMPVLDGIEATKQIRTFKSKEELIIIAMTAAVFAQDKQAALDCGMNAHISKPIQMYELACALAEHVKLNTHRKVNMPTAIKQEFATFDLKHLANYVDIQAVKDNFSHNPRLYESCLSHFIREFGDWNELVTHALSQGNVVKVRNETHRLKGASGNLYLKDIYAESTKLIYAIDHNQTAEISALQKLLKTFLDDMLNQAMAQKANTSAKIIVS